MSRRHRQRRDDFGGESWLSSRLKTLRRRWKRLRGKDRSLELGGRKEPLWRSRLLLIPRAVYELFRFLIVDWSSSRRGRAFLYALPALLTVAAFFTLQTIANWRLETRRALFYAERLEYYGKQEDHEFAKSCALKLVELRPTDENKYKLALAYRKLEDFDSTFSLMSALAPEEKTPPKLLALEAAAGAGPSLDQPASGGQGGIAVPGTVPGTVPDAVPGTAPDAAPDKRGDESSVPPIPQSDTTEPIPSLVFTGYAPAHLWLADLAAFGKEWQLTLEERTTKARLHYSAAFELAKSSNTPESIYAALRLAELQLQEHDTSAAEATLRTATAKPVLTLLHLQAIVKLLAVLKEQDKLPEIKATALNLEPKLFKLAADMPDQIEPWQALVDVASQAENYREADSYIQSALAMCKDPNTRKGLIQLRAGLLVRQALTIQDADSEARYTEKFGYLAAAISIDPTNERIYLALLPYVDLDPQNPSEDDYLRLALGSGKTPGVTHIVLGLRDAQRNERLAAFNHWEIADTQTERSEWLCGMFARLLLQAKTMDKTEFFRFLSICKEHYPEQPLLQLAEADAYLKLNEAPAAALPLLEKLIASNGNFLAARESYITALRASGRTAEADKERLKLTEQVAEAQKRQSQANLKEND